MIGWSSVPHSSTRTKHPSSDGRTIRAPDHVWTKLFLLLVAGAATYAWWPVMSLPFLGDDFEILRSVQSRGPFGMWMRDSTALFRPVASASSWLDVVVHQADVWLTHAHSFVLYVLIALVLRGVARRLQLPQAAPLSLLFFALANHAEPVAWFAARADLLATLFLLASVWLCVTPGKLAAVTSVAFGAMALLSKESAVVVAPIAALVCAASNRPQIRPLLLGALTLTYLFVRRLAIGEWIGGYGAEALPARRWDTVARISDLLMTPFGLSHAACALLLIGLIAAAALLHDRRKNLLLLIAAALSAVPVAGLNGALADGENGRLTLLPSALACLFIGSLVGRHPIATAVLIVLTLLQIPVIHERTNQWADAGLAVERYLAKLSELPPANARAVAVPGWIGPACALCTGTDAALSLRTGGERTRILAVARYRADTPDCLPVPVEGRYEVNVLLPSCGAWVDPQEHLPGLELISDGATLQLRGTGALFIERPQELIPLVPPLR